MRASMRTGLVLTILLGLFDVVLPIGGVDGPPLPVAIAGAILGLITIVAAVFAWRSGASGSRAGVMTVVVTRILSALTAVPAFFASDVPAEAQVAAAAICGLTVVAVALLVPGLRKPQLA